MKHEHSSLLFALRLLMSAGWHFGLAGAFAITWVAPYTFGPFTVHKFTFMMLLEFLVVHSAGFLGAIASKGDSRGHRIFMLSVLLALYLLFVAAFCAMYGGPWPLIAFALLTMPRVQTVLFRPVDDDTQFALMANWAAMVALYLFSIFAGLTLEVPQLGVTDDVIAAQEFGMEGEFPEHPYKVMAMGVIYFSGLGVLAIINEVLAARRERRAAVVKKDDGVRRAGEY